MELSLVIPVYNMQDFLPRTLDDIVRQEYLFSKLELIIVDDASTDNSVAIVEKYKKKLNIKHIILTERISTGMVRNIGMKECTCDFVGFLDADDLISLDAAYRLSRAIDKHDCDFGMCDYMKYNLRDKRIMGVHKASDYVSNKGIYHRDDFSGHYFQALTTACWNKIYKRSFLMEHHIAFSDAVYAEDMAFTMKVMIHCNRFFYLDDPMILYTYPIYNEKSNDQNSYKTWPDLFHCFQDAWEELCSHMDGPERNSWIDSLILEVVDHTEYALSKIEKKTAVSDGQNALYQKCSEMLMCLERGRIKMK